MAKAVVLGDEAYRFAFFDENGVFGHASRVDGLEAFIAEVEAAAREGRLAHTPDLFVGGLDPKLGAWAERLARSMGAETWNFLVHDSKTKKTYKVTHAWVNEPTGSGGVYPMVVNEVVRSDEQPPPR